MSPTPDRTLDDPQQTIADLKRQLAESNAERDHLRSERDEALGRETATAEVLQVINSSPGDLAPVFDAILEKAHALCGAAYGGLIIRDRENFRVVAVHGEEGFAEAWRQAIKIRPPEGSPLARLIGGERTIHLADAGADENLHDFPPEIQRLNVAWGVRTLLAVPLLKDRAVLGVISAFRQEVQPFSDQQIALLENFAAQAVIAIENARLLTETREALEQQTATAEVLQVINSSPGDLAPVFNAMLEKAIALCDATFGTLWTYDGEHMHAAAVLGATPRYTEFLRAAPHPPSPVAHQPLLGGAPVVHIPDVSAHESYRSGFARALVDLGGVRTLLAVPLRKDGALLGIFSIYRSEVRPFTDKQIALLQNFAAQAVIAIENARLLTETREALEQQIATTEVLQVINSSPGDLAPVFDAMLERAMALCGIAHGSLQTYDGQQFRAVAVRGHPEPLAALLRQGYRPGPTHPMRELLEGARFVQIPDLTQLAPDIGIAVRTAVEAGSRTLLCIPLRKDDLLLGQITAVRREVRPFSGKEIALLENFAAQAVIAMENARLLTETREALEQQTATAEVLQVINSSPGDLAPVFQSILEKAHDLCGTDTGRLFTYDGECFKAVAAHGISARLFSELRPGGFRPAPGNPFAGVLEGAPLVHIADLREVTAHPDDVGLRTAIEIGVRSFLLVPLRKDNVLLGAITANRREVRPFSEKEIALLQNFAAQAVIAMENARLLTETREALEQQTATAEVLQVINSSPGDLAPVFDAILEKAHTLCGATKGSLVTVDGEHFRTVAMRGLSEPYAAILREAQHNVPGSVPDRLLKGESLVHLSDARDSEFPIPRAVAELEGVRIILYVPLRKDRALLGYITAYRQEVRPFTDKEIALLQNFAAQAVIAMDNARLLNEIRQHQAELRVTFDNMGDGVAMFDAQRRLAAWNMNFQQLLELPEAFLAERPHYNVYLRYLADRGEFGSDDVAAELSRRLEHTDEELRFERTRPDGRVIEVRRNAVPGGGFVLIYGDITERKRAEAEIHAARDAAEKALSELKAAQASLIQAEKMASLGQLTAGIAHEIKNPLNFVNNFASLSTELLDELKEAAAPALAGLSVDQRGEIDETIGLLTGNLDKIAEHGRRADGIVKSMLEHSRGATGERRAVNLNALVDEALNLAYHGARAQDQDFNITLEREFEPSLAPIEIAPQEMTRVFLNLFSNGFYAANKRRDQVGSPQFRPTLKVMTCHTGDTVEVHVRDNGTGIPPEIRDQLFQPFFTTKPTGEGTGLGLSISWDIVTQQHGGSIDVDSEPGEFTEFTIRLPRNGQAAGRGA
jgi:GAF domain-containing protein/two-component sensor histidine kinase